MAAGFSWRRAAASLAVLAVTAALIEAVSYAVLAQGGYLPNAPAPTVLQVFGDVLVSNGDVLSIKKNFRQRWVTPEYEIEVRTNSDGYRENFEFVHPDVEVAFMGDSFAFGNGVDVDDRYTNVFAATLKDRINPRHVVSLSYKNGFEPEHYEYYLKKNPDLRPRYVVLALALGGDMDSDLRETIFDRRTLSLQLPYRKTEYGVLLNNTLSIIPYFDTLTRVSNFFRLTAILVNRSKYRDYLYSSDAVLPNTPNAEALEFGALNPQAERVFQAIGAVRDHIAAWNGRLVVLVIPQNFYFGATPHPHIRPELVSRIPDIVRGGGLRATVLTHCRELKLECVDPSPVLEAADYYPADAHWTRSGNRKVGEMLARYFIEKGYL